MSFAGPQYWPRLARKRDLVGPLMNHSAISGERGNKRNLVLLCIGLSLPRQIAFELCKMCPKATIDPQAPQDSRYSNLIVYGQNLPVKIVKQLLDKKDKTDRKGYTKTI